MLNEKLQNDDKYSKLEFVYIKTYKSIPYNIYC